MRCVRAPATKRGLITTLVPVCVFWEMFLASAPCLAQRSTENAVTSASDAFGNSIGAETIGLYSATDVRGFSPVAAGNLRLDGLYFDQLDFVNPRLFERRVVRVGPSAQGYPFPAPTGIVDHYLRTPGDRAILSLVADGQSFAGGGLELDATIPVGGMFGFAGGASLRRDTDYPGGDYVNAATSGVIASWRPDERSGVEAFVGRISFRDDRTTPYVFAGGSRLPPILSRGYLGQKWAAWHSDLDNLGLTGRVRLGSWQLRAGGFRHVISIERSFDILFLDTDPNGSGRLVINADPPQQWTYNSGELRLSRTIETGGWRHTLHISARGGQRQRSYGGTGSEDFGQFTIDNRPILSEPEFAFAPQSHDRTRQWAGGVAYGGQWAGRGEIGFGIQKLRYRKSVTAPEAASIQTRADPWLWNGTIAVNVTRAFVAYGGYTRGLEESAVAPANASNRNEAPPALLTSQRDLGLVLRLEPDFRFILGAFDVRKPYFNVDTGGVFRQLGTVRHRGLEFSVNGTPATGLSLIAGAVLLRPRITGEAVGQGLIGPKPVAQAGRVVKLNIDYRLPAVAQLSLDLAVTHTGSRVVSPDNHLIEPGHTTADAGGRYRFHVDGSLATLRLLVANVTNANGWNVVSSGGLRPITPRRATLAVTVDL